MQVEKRIQRPIEGKWFDVNPETINKKIYKRRRNDVKQEQTRQFILEAFKEVECNPNRYAAPFRTIMPEKTWSAINFEKSQNVAKQLQGYMADWVEQGLEWAQRIDNGESWESVSNEADKANWYRIVMWKNGKLRLVGGACLNNSNYSASDVCDFDFDLNNEFFDAVPLIASRK